MVRTSVTHSANASCATFLFLPHFDVICDLLLNRRTATWNLFVKWNLEPQASAGSAVNFDNVKTNLSSIRRQTQKACVNLLFTKTRPQSGQMPGIKEGESASTCRKQNR